ncbi:hypothetical protein Tco_0849885 [Tanacetum coccineum]
MTTLVLLVRKESNARPPVRPKQDQFSEVTLDGFELILWGDLKIMMESSTEGNEQSDFWSGQQDWKIVTWRLYESCGVCILEFEDGIVIHMLVERRYPLSKDLLQKMLDLGLEVERESSVALDLIRHKNWLVHKQTACGKDFSNLFMVDNLPKIVGFLTHLASVVKSWLVHDQTVHALASPKANELTIPEQTATGKGTSNPLMAVTSGENLGGHSSSDKSLSGNEGDMTFQSVYDLCLSLCAQHHKAWLKSVSLKQRFPRKSFSKKHRVHKESVSKQGRKFAKGESSVQKDPLFDEILEDTVDHMETENAHNEGRTKEMVDEDKEIDENILSTEDVLSTDKEGVSTDMEKVSTDTPIVSTDGSKVSTDRPNEGTEEKNEGTEEKNEGTEEHIGGTEENFEGTEEHKKGTEEEIDTQATQTPTSTIFGDDETIAKVLLNMSQAKAVSREKEKGVKLKDIKEVDRLRPTSTRSLLTLKPLSKIDPKDKGKKKIEEVDESESESDGIPEAEKKFKQLESDEEMARKIQEEIEADRFLAEKLQEQEREQFTIEEMAKFLHDIIAAQRKFLAQQRLEAIRNRPPTKNQLRNQMMTYLKHVGNFKHAGLKTKKFEEIQALYEKIKRSDEDFISIRSAEDERLIKKMNEKGIDSSNNEMVKEEDKEEEDIEIMEKKSVIARLNKVSSPDGDYLVIYRANGNFRAFNYLMEVLHIFDRQDLFHLYDLIRDQFSEVTLDGFELILWGDLKIMMESSTEGNEQSDFWSGQQDWKIVTWRLYESCGVCILEFEDGIVIHMLVERRYPLSKDLLQKMLDLGLEVERESSVALDLIRHKNWLVHKQTACGKDFSNPFMVDNLPKIVGFSTHLASLVKSWLVQDQTVLALASPKANELTIPEQTATGKGTSNPFMAGSLPKTTKPT